MSVTLIVTRLIDRSGNPTGRAIDRLEWLRIIEADDELLLDTEGATATNPGTNEVVRIPQGDAQTEFRIADRMVPFLQFRSGELVTKYRHEFDDPANPVRRKIADVARKLDAVITHDAGDEVLDW